MTELPVVIMPKQDEMEMKSVWI